MDASACSDLLFVPHLDHTIRDITASKLVRVLGKEGGEGLSASRLDRFAYAARSALGYRFLGNIISILAQKIYPKYYHAVVEDPAELQKPDVERSPLRFPLSLYPALNRVCSHSELSLLPQASG